ncbi:MAG: ABC transporter permease [Pseudohongiellaceae bacterium]
MRRIWLISKNELRYWQRSRLAWCMLLALALVSISSAIVSSAELSQRDEARRQQQAEANAIFLAQPDRHPHRMVHYGHYVYRTPSPLAAVDSGIDSIVGTSIFLEGHRQNTTTFATARETGLLARFGALSPAFVMQVIVPLLLIICGFAAVTRERENNSLYQLLGQGVTGGILLLGKGLALLIAGVLALVPMVVLGYVATGGAWESYQSLWVMAFGYLIYLMIWAALIVSVSAWVKTSSLALSSLLGLWMVTVVLMPRLASEVASVAAPAAGNTETGLYTAQALRTAGDGHNANDPAFNDLLSQALAEHDVERVEDLPFNYRGLVALRSEETETRALNEQSHSRMEQERQQKMLADRFGFLSPSIAMRAFSMAMAGTGLEAYHQFLQTAEAYRYNMVQTFNRLHMNELRYADDIARSVSDMAEQNARISSRNWADMPAFEYVPTSHGERWQAALPAAFNLAFWAITAIVCLVLASRRVSRRVDR